MKFEVVNGSNQIETQSKTFASIAIAFTQNSKNLQATNDMLSENALAGEFTISRFLYDCERVKFRFLSWYSALGMQFVDAQIACVT